MGRPNMRNYSSETFCTPDDCWKLKLKFCILLDATGTSIMHGAAPHWFTEYMGIVVGVITDMLL